MSQVSCLFGLWGIPLLVLVGCAMGAEPPSGEPAKDESSKAVPKTAEQWKKQLTPEQFRVTRMKGTERPFSGEYYKLDKEGIYRCVCCGAKLFESQTKFDAGCGWPSFYKPAEADNILYLPDRTHGMERIEVQCKKCGAHLGHVFDDGPKPTGQRYCINSASLKFEAKKKTVEATHQLATFGGGCFWGVQSAFKQVKGVIDTAAGYEGGTKANPTYQDVCTHKTGHAEVVQVEFDPAVVSYDKLLDVFWAIHDPTQKNRQGPDIGTNYRSAIFYHTPEQKAAAEASKERLQKSGKLKKPIVTEITAATHFWEAEGYHQNYFERNGLPSCHTVPPDLLK